MKKNLLLYIGVLMMFLAGCQDEGMFTPEEDASETPVNVSFRVKMGGEEMSRAIGDASLVNELIVGVFQDSKLLKTFTFTREEGQEMFTNVTIPLFKNQKYDLAFWAQVKNNGIYSIDDDFNITIDYSKYNGISLAGTEAFEAFTTVKTEVTVANGGGEITLTRPFAQLNIAASEAEIFDNVDANSFTISKVYTTYNLFTGAVVGDVKENQEFSFTFSTEDIDAKQSIMIGEEAYYYLASAYLLAPEKVNMTGALYKDGEEYRALSFTDLPLAANTRTNIYGDMIQQEELQGWDGVTFADLSDEGLTCQVQVEGANNVLHIDTPEELAYCMKNGYPSGYDAIHICANHNMGGHVWDNVANVPNGIIIEGTSADGKQSHYISSVKLQGTTTGLFGNTEDLKVGNLQLKEIEVNTASDMVGVLAGTVKGNSSFANVVIDNCYVVADYGKAGGMVGYISRKSEKERTETLSVSFNGCRVNNSTISASAAEGIFVGELSGYDNQETLSFDAECSAENTTVTDFVSSYQSVNQSVWLDAVDTKYNGWLGTETYRRGVVKFGEVQLVPKWDGTTKVEPLKDGNTILIYSAFDLATLQGAKPTAVTFKTNVDLGSHKFKPIYSVQTLEGENNTVYNLTVLMEKHDGMGAAFIQSAPTGKVNVSHKNLILIGAGVKNYHDTSLYPAFGVTNDGGAGNAYGGIFISKANSCESYTIDNIHVKDSKLYAVCKMGGIIGQSVDTKLYMSNCSVDNCIIQNYKPNVPNYYVLGDDSQPWMVKSSLYINLLQWWYTNGEAGGLIGFLQNSDSDIDNCSVTNTQINCSGQDNKTVVANVYSEKQFDKNNLWKANKSITAKGETTIAGRHVNQFIGDVVSYSSTEGGTNYTVDITNYTVSGNSYNGTLAESTNKYNHQYDKSGDKYGTNANLYCEVVGCAYYIGLDIIVIGQNLGHLKYYAGNVAFSSKDGQTNGSFTEASGEGDNINIAWTGGNFKITGALWGVKSEYPTEPARKDPEY